MGSVNVNRSISDAFYRYKMPRIQAKVEGKGNGIKTVIVNMVEVAKAIGRPATYPTKFFGCELGAQTQFDFKNERFIVNGSHDASKLQDLLDGFIRKYVLCPNCDNPETELLVNAKKGTISQGCKACGHHGMLESNHKLNTYILKNPPSLDPAAQGSSLTEGKRGKRSKRATNGEANGDRTGSPDNENNSNSTTDIVVEAPEKMANKDDNADDDNWAVDVSEEAVRARLQDLTDGAKGMTISDDLEKSEKERMDIFYTLVKCRRDAGQLDCYKEFLAEAERLEIKSKAPFVFAELLFDENIAYQVKKYRPVLLRFTHNDLKAQKYLIKGIEQVIGLHKSTLLNKVPGIFKLLYDYDYLDEKAIFEWSNKMRKKPVPKDGSKDISQEIHEKAAPFLIWLDEAEEESDFDDSDDDTGKSDDDDLEVDTRKQDELNVLFDCINAECASRSLKEKRKALASPEKQDKIVKAVHYGPVPGLRSGKWWGIRMDCSRDYIHEPFNEDIHDGPFGAVSICTSHLNTHNDVDVGDILTFTSKKYSKIDQSKDSLILSYKNRVPIRLVRSYCLSNSYAPKTGYRYDGLYTVVDHWIGISSDTTKYNKFVLIRVFEQERPSWTEKSSSKVLKIKKSITPRLTRSNVNVNHHEPKTTKFVYNKVQKESKVANVSAIVSRQVFKKFIPDSPDSSPKSVSSTDSAGQSSCPTTCPTKLCNTNLSIRTNLYDSSHKLQEAKKGTSMTFCRILKSNQSVQPVQKSPQAEAEKLNIEIPEIEVTEKIKIINSSAEDKCGERKIKKVTWADSCISASNSIQKSLPTTGNGFKYSGSGVVDGFSPTSPKKCILTCNNITEHLAIKNSKSNNLLSPSTKSHQHIVQIHSKSNTPQTSKASFSAICESFHETERFNDSSSSIDTLAPDELVNVIVKEKYHPMAKLLIGNMIGLENQESAILSAYNTLTSKADQDEPIKSKANKIRNKFFIRNKSKKSGVIQKQRREITNLIIDAKFNPITRGLRSRRLRSLKKRISRSELSQRKLINAQRMQARNTMVNKEIQSTIRDLEPKKIEKRKADGILPTKQSKMVSTWTQCTLLAAPSVDQSVQIGDSYVETSISESDIKVELVDLDDIKSEPCDAESSSEEIPSEPVMSRTEKSYFSGSAFAAVNTINSSIRITRLRSIGFRPIGSYSPLEDEDWNQDSVRPDVNEEYNKYTSEENNVVGYMDEQLHFEDIEEEETTDAVEERVMLDKTCGKQLIREASQQAIENLSEHDFDRPWHGWRKRSINGQIHWSGY